MKHYILAALAALLPGTALAECGSVDAPCEMVDGTYHISLPEKPTEGPVLVFLHGFGGQGSGTIRNRRLVDPLLARGWTVIAPNGQWRDGPGSIRRWDFRRDMGPRDDFAFVQDVVADASLRFGVPADRAVLGGFSNGAFLATYAACETPDAFTAFVPVAGTFWRPQPTECQGPVRLLQTHGWQDGTVPLEGRPLGGGRWEQGDVFAGLELFRIANGCRANDPDEVEMGDIFWHRVWTACTPGSALEFALFPGGHTVPQGWADMMADWYEAMPAAEG